MKRIVLMDDSVSFLEVARGALEQAGAGVRTANDLESFQQARLQKPADRVLMDVPVPVEVRSDESPASIAGRARI